MEEKVIENMKENPKVFYNHVRKQKDRDTKIGPFKIGEEYIYNNKKKYANCLFNSTTPKIVKGAK